MEKKNYDVKKLLDLLDTYRSIADQALGLADAYSGSDSETAKELASCFERADEIRRRLLGTTYGSYTRMPL